MTGRSLRCRRISEINYKTKIQQLTIKKENRLTGRRLRCRVE
jgi:hypothetical protein